MGRAQGRGPEDTKRLLLDAAGRVLSTKGTSATLDDIAREAGVSKGGLLYHFASKDDLLVALTHDVLDEFRVCVDAELDPDDDAPGAFTRAYVRALLAPQGPDDPVAEKVVLLGLLLTIPSVATIARDDAEAIDTRLRNDGLPQDVMVLVVSAADGANAAPTWGGSPRPEAELAALKEYLLALTRQ